eukprot:14005299-Alexandrium_andersonii.AAC.1
MSGSWGQLELGAESSWDSRPKLCSMGLPGVKVGARPKVELGTESFWGSRTEFSTTSSRRFQQELLG